jgi:hypothetical protein
MSRCVIDTIVLEPYSTERLIVVCGYNYDEVVEWFKGLFSTTNEKNLNKIRLHYQWYNEHLKFFSDVKADIDKLNEGKTTVEGSYISQELKSYPGSKMRMVLLRDAWQPSNPGNMITLAHELLHLCQEFLPMFLDRDVEHEAEAYFHTNLMTKIINYFS